MLLAITREWLANRDNWRVLTKIHWSQKVTWIHTHTSWYIETPHTMYGASEKLENNIFLLFLKSESNNDHIYVSFCIFVEKIYDFQLKYDDNTEIQIICSVWRDSKPKLMNFYFTWSLGACQYKKLSCFEIIINRQEEFPCNAKTKSKLDCS